MSRRTPIRNKIRGREVVGNIGVPSTSHRAGSSASATKSGLPPLRMTLLV